MKCKHSSQLNAGSVVTCANCGTRLCPKCGGEMYEIDTVADDGVSDAILYWCDCGHEEKVKEEK